MATDPLDIFRLGKSQIVKSRQKKSVVTSDFLPEIGAEVKEWNEWTGGWDKLIIVGRHRETLSSFIKHHLGTAHPKLILGGIVGKIIKIKFHIELLKKTVA